MRTTALVIAKSNYDLFEDKKDITALCNALLSVESSYSIRDDEGNRTNGYRDDVSDAIIDVIMREFIHSKRRTPEIRELCVKIINEMQY
jgi:hypothetical protein